MTALDRMRQSERDMGLPDGVLAAQNYLASKQRPLNNLRQKRRSTGPLFICLIGFLVAVFGIAIITG